MSLTFLEKLEEKAEAKGEQNIVLEALRAKFNKIPKHTETTIRQMSDLIVLKSLIHDVIKSQTIDEFAKSLK
jgi:hypothetical protein